MTMLKNTKATLLSRTGAIALLVMAGFTMVAGAPAHAGGDSFSVSISLGNRGNGIAIGGCVTDPCQPRVSREFRRGFESGANDGFEAGFKAGLYGWRFCCDIADLPCHVSREFRRGYESAYGEAYRKGFERGTCERRERECREHEWRDRHRGHGKPWRKDC